MKVLLCYFLPGLLLLYSCQLNGKGKPASSLDTTGLGSVSSVDADTSYQSFRADTSLRFTNTPSLLNYMDSVTNRWEYYKSGLISREPGNKELIFQLQRFGYLNQDLLTCLVFQYLRAAPKVQGNLFLTNYNDEFSRLISPAERLSVFLLFPEPLRNSPQGKSIFSKLNRLVAQKQEMAVSIKSAIQSEHFPVETSDGRTLALQDLFSPGYNRYLVIFGASWCSPCRYENAWLKKKMAITTPTSLKIIHISIDTNRDKWLRAAIEDQCPWEQVRVNGQESPVARFFKLEGVPFNILLDKDWIPVAREINIENIWNKIDPKQKSQ